MCAQTAALKQLYSVIKNKDTYETKADSMTNAFIESFMIKNKGIFNDKYGHYQYNIYWQQAHAIDVVIYNYQRHKNIDRSLASKYLNYIKLWYKNKGNNYEGAAARSTTGITPSSDYKMFENHFIDDMCWITLTLLHIGEASGTQGYTTVAKSVFDKYIITHANADEQTGGLWLTQKTDNAGSVSACTQSPATLIAAKLFQSTGDSIYLDYAKRLYKYAAKNMVKSDGRVEEPPLTYTQGTFGEACRILYHVTDESTTMKSKYKSLAYTYINYAFTSDRVISEGSNNILRDEGHNADQSIFKAVLIPYAVNFVLDESMTQNANQPYRKNILNYILANANIMWKNLDLEHYPKVFCNYFWGSPYTGTDSNASMGATCSGSSLIENTARMCRAIVDRYELSSLLTNCNKYVVDPEYEEEDVSVAFNSAKQTAAEIMANPSNYTTYEFRQAIENLEATYQALQDFVTGIKTPSYSSLKDEDIYDLNGRKMNGRNLPRGIYIKGGRKIIKN